MNIIYTKSFDSTNKNLSKHRNEKTNLKIISELIQNTNNFQELKNNPISYRYGFEQLKYDLNEFWSFNLCKNGGVIRLIIKPSNNNDYELYFLFISYSHYKDFSKDKVIYYDE